MGERFGRGFEVGFEGGVGGFGGDGSFEGDEVADLVIHF